MKFVIITLLATIHWTCIAAEEFTASKIGTRATLSSLLKSARTGLQMRFTNGGETEGSGSYRGGFETFMTVECDDAARRRFMSSFRSATQKLLREDDATITGWGRRGSAEDLNGFSWEYGWNENSGVFLVRFFPSADGKGTLTIFCYEHLRGAPPLPAAKNID